MAAGGTIVRGSDGATYFIRDEVLEACRVEGEYADHVEQILNAEQNEVQGFSFNMQQIEPTSATLKPVAYVSGDLLSTSQPSTDLKNVASTVMCPW